MKKINKVSDLFKLPDRGKSYATSINQIWSFFYRDVIGKRNISLSDHNSYVNRYMSETGKLGKETSTFKSNLNGVNGLAGDALTWQRYISALKMYRCVKTTVTIEHEWSDGTITYHHRVLQHRRKGLIILDEEK